MNADRFCYNLLIARGEEIEADWRTTTLDDEMTLRWGVPGGRAASREML
jgi:hypothetical protein